MGVAFQYFSGHLLQITASAFPRQTVTQGFHWTIWNGQQQQATPDIFAAADAQSTGTLSTNVDYVVYPAQGVSLIKLSYKVE